MATESEPQGFRIGVVPTEEGIRRPVSFANTVQIVGDPSGLTLYFFSAPADANNLSGTKELLEKARHVGEANPLVMLHLDPIAKIYLPLEFGPVLVESLARNVALWKQLRETGMPQAGFEAKK
jgi:hypothetical protein